VDFWAQNGTHDNSESENRAVKASRFSPSGLLRGQWGAASNKCVRKLSWVPFCAQHLGTRYGFASVPSVRPDFFSDTVDVRTQGLPDTL
jgi:hypothetical protein